MFTTLIGAVATDRRVFFMKPPKVEVIIKVNVAWCLFGIAAIITALV